jgi:hypothetical protein
VPLGKSRLSPAKGRLIAGSAAAAAVPPPEWDGSGDAKQIARKAGGLFRFCRRPATERETDSEESWVCSDSVAGQQRRFKCFG